MFDQTENETLLSSLETNSYNLSDKHVFSVVSDRNVKIHINSYYFSVKLQLIPIVFMKFPWFPVIRFVFRFQCGLKSNFVPRTDMNVVASSFKP